MHRLPKPPNSGPTSQLSCWEFLGSSLPLLEPQTSCLGNREYAGSAGSQTSQPTRRVPGTCLPLKGLLWWLGRVGLSPPRGEGGEIYLALCPAMAPHLETGNPGPPLSRPVPSGSQSLCLWAGDSAACLDINTAVLSLENYYIQFT